MVHFVGAGPGAPDLITVRGKNLLEKADVVIYAGSLVNPELLTGTRKDCDPPSMEPSGSRWMHSMRLEFPMTVVRG